jgi:hypothetical protein
MDEGVPVADHEGLRHRHHADAAGGAGAPAVHPAAATALRDGSGSPLSLEGMASGSDDDGPDRPVEPRDGAPVAELEPEPQPTRTREEDAAPAVAAAEPLWRWIDSREAPSGRNKGNWRFASRRLTF